MNKRSETRLFALLICDSFIDMRWNAIFEAFRTHTVADLTEANRYVEFLKRNADSRHSNAYAQAVRMIERGA